MSAHDHLPPYSAQSEQGVLGCIMLDPADCLGTCAERGMRPEWFYDLRHQILYEHMLAKYDAAEPIDLITLQQGLKDRQLLDQIGGIGYLSSLPDAVPSAANLSYYLKTLEDKFLMRSLIRLCTETVSAVHKDESQSANDLFDRVEAEVMQIRRARVGESRLTIKQLVLKAIDSIQYRFEHRGVIGGLTTGFMDLDRAMDGMKPQEYIVIAARPSAGKTSLAMNIAGHVGVDLNIPVGVFSLEMSAESLVHRMIAARARVNLRALLDGFLKDNDFPRISLAAAQINKAPIHIDDAAGLSVQRLRAKARRMVQQHGVKLFVVDYMQRLHTTNKRAENRQQEVSDISAGLKDMAMELGVPVIALSQLNRDLERDKNRKPRLSDLRESGGIEQDGDFIGLLYKPAADEEDKAADNIPVNMLVAKQRNGASGFDIRFTFWKQYTRFENAAKIAPEDVPV